MYWREAISTIVYTLNQVQIKKGTNATPFELWYDHSPNVKNFKVFGCKFYILKESRNEKFDVKSDKGIFLVYSTRRKTYKCLNVNTNKVVESENVKFDELTEVQNDEWTKKIEEYKSFVYFYEGMPNDGEVATQNDNQQKKIVFAE